MPLSGSAPAPLFDGIDRTEDIGVTWRGRDATVGMLLAPGGGRRIVTGNAGPEAEQAAVTGPNGFAAPLAWSPSGRYLVVRRFTGDDTAAPGAEQPALFDRETAAWRDITGSGALEFVGWSADAP